MTRSIPAITLWQPWASLIFTGDKQHETRGFRLPDRLAGDLVAIHAAARPVRRQDLSAGLHALCLERLGRSYEFNLPLGQVLGVVRFGTAFATGDPALEPDVGSADRYAGDWSPSRWAWPIVLAQALDKPMPAKGRQGWWRVEIDEEATRI